MIREKHLDSTDPLRSYLNEIGTYELLTKEDEVLLAQQIEAGKEASNALENGDVRPELYEVCASGLAAHELFVKSNLRLVVSISKKYARNCTSMELLDLIQEGNLGLSHAVDLFEWRQDFKFSTYATWWIKQSVLRAIRTKDSIIRVPDHVWDQDPISYDRRSQESSPNALVAAAAVARSVVSYDRPIGDEAAGDRSLIDVIPDRSVKEPDTAVVQAQQREFLESLFSSALLNEEERWVVRRFYGFDDERLSLQQMGDLHGKTKDDMYQIKSRALRLIRGHLERHTIPPESVIL